MNGFYEPNYFNGLDRFETDPVLDRYMDMTLELCEKHGIPVMIEHNPVNDATYSCISDSFWASWKVYFEKMKESHPDVDVSMTIERYDGSLFGDDIHLNAQGSARYSERITSRLRSAD